MPKIHLILILSLLILNKVIAQEKFDLNQIEKEITTSNKSMIKKDFVMTYSHIEKIAISRTYLSSLTGINRNYFTCSMYFYGINYLKIGFYVNDLYFDYENFRKIIPEDHEDLRTIVIISTEIYKTDSIPIILVNDIKLKD